MKKTLNFFRPFLASTIRASLIALGLTKWLLSLAAVLALASCDHKELCYDHLHSLLHLQVVFDWSHARTASPASMSLYLFPADGGESIRNEFTNPAGGEIRTTEGCYDALCLNSDAEGIRYRNTEKWETFEITTETTTMLPEFSSLGFRSDEAPRALGAENERVAAPPRMVWSDRRTGVDVSAAEHRLTLSPSSAVGRCTVEIRHAENLAQVQELSASLSGMAGGFLVGTGTASSERVTIPFELEKSDETTLTGVVQTFGHCPSEQTAHMLIVYAILADGRKWYYTYDVTEQIHSAPDQQDIRILLDGLPLPEAASSGGFRPTVESWQDVYIDIEM